MEAAHIEATESTDEVALEAVERCDLCGGRAFTPRRRWTDQLLFGTRPWTLVECDGCSLCFLDPRPTPAAIGAFYPADYPAHTDRPVTPKRWHRRVAAEGAPPLRPWERPWIRMRQDVSWYRMPRWHGDGRVLDVGCGNGGRYLDILRALGWATHGVDPSPAAVERVRAKGHEALVGTADAHGFPAGSMDVVTLWHCLEHTHSPRRALETAFQTLRPGGLLSLGVPNYRSLQAALFRGCWSGAEVPRHLFHFSRRTLRRYLGETGFRVLSVTTRTGATSWPRAARHLVNTVFGTRWARDPGWLVELFEPLAHALSLVRYFGIGAELRIMAERPA
ncbi:MAG TPA: class I SAM-dependent methyltransferase [Kofleriaceae bacterium]|nr:class I SAM-dependent methyltransferase [Kofleriaceae bacterium]